MKPTTLIDLYFPAHVAEPAEVAEAAQQAGVDGVVLVADSSDELPDQELVSAVNDAGGPQLYRACALSGVGFRVAVLVAGDIDEVNLDAIEASGDLALIQQAVAEFGGCALPICPRQGAEGEILRQVASLPAEPTVGIVAMVAGGSRLGRDLDIEDAGIYNRRVLAATGPFGSIDDFGRYATLLPAAADKLPDIIRCLNQGYGVGVEFGQDRSAERSVPQPKRGRKRRRRRRGGRDQQGNNGGDAQQPAS